MPKPINPWSKKKAVTRSPETWSEAKIQMYVATQALRDGYLFHADGNGANKGRSGGNRMKLQGARAGWPDMCFILNGRNVWFELKTYTGKISKVQSDLHERMRDLGCEVWVVFAKDGPEAWEMIKGILDSVKNSH